MEGNFVLLGKHPAFLKRMRFERISLYSLVVISGISRICEWLQMSEKPTLSCNSEVGLFSVKNPRVKYIYKSNPRKPLI